MAVQTDGTMGVLKGHSWRDLASNDQWNGQFQVSAWPS